MTVRSHVLLVDDDELTLQMLEATLEGSFQVSQVSSGAEALARCQTDPPDLVVLDVDMPELDGYETCRRLKAGGASAEIPVIFHSARTSIEERLQGYAAGGADYLAKPFDASELLAKIHLVLAHSDRQRELSGQLNEVKNAVLSSADRVGEAGVVLEFQRQLVGCDSHEAVARAMIAALQRYALDGCVRIRGGGEVYSGNARGPCSALENSILDHLQKQAEGQRIRPFGPHTGFSFGQVVLFVRDLRLERPADIERSESERMGRAIDNVTLLVEGALQRVGALEAVVASKDLADVRYLVSMTRDALTDISARNQAQRQEVRQVFDSLNSEVENSFLHLGLNPSQEDHLSSIIKQHLEAAMSALGKSQEVEKFLGRVIHKLGQHAL